MDICFILVEPAVPGNVGAAARAIKTMGFKHLRLVNPCDHLSMEAKMLAHASGEILEEAEIYPGLAEAVADLDLSIATTAKARDARVEFHLNTELPELIRSKGKMVNHTGIVFGREESGLSNDEIRICDLASTIPLKQPYPSLNLAQAVMIYAYTLADFSAREKAVKNSGIPQSDVSVSDPEQYRIMMDRSKDALRKIGIEKNPALYNRILERIALLNEDDIHLLLSVLAKLE